MLLTLLRSTLFGSDKTIRERPIRFYSIRCRKISTDSIPIRFVYLIAYFVRRNDDDGGHRWTEYWHRDTAATVAARERRESEQKGGSREGTEKDRGGWSDQPPARGTPSTAPWHMTALRAALRACDRPVT